MQCNPKNSWMRGHSNIYTSLRNLREREPSATSDRPATFGFSRVLGPDYAYVRPKNNGVAVPLGAPASGSEAIDSVW